MFRPIDWFVLAPGDLPVLRGGKAGVALERPGKVALVYETGLEGKIAKRHVCSRQLNGSPIEPQPPDVCARRNAKMGAEDPRQVYGVYRDLFRDCRDTQRLRKPLV